MCFCLCCFTSSDRQLLVDLRDKYSVAHGEALSYMVANTSDDEQLQLNLSDRSDSDETTEKIEMKPQKDEIAPQEALDDNSNAVGDIGDWNSRFQSALFCE